MYPRSAGSFESVSMNLECLKGISLSMSCELQGRLTFNILTLDAIRRLYMGSSLLLGL